MDAPEGLPAEEIEYGVARKMPVRATRYPIKPVGPNLIVDLRHFNGTRLYGLIQYAKTEKDGFLLYTDKKRKQPRYRVRRRRALEYRTRTFDFISLGEKDEYHLGGLRHRIPRFYSPSTWELFNWEDETLGEFRQLGSLNLGLFKLRDPLELFAGREYGFFVDEDRFGRIRRWLGRGVVRLAGEIDLDPDYDRYAELLRVCPALFLSVRWR